jgi:glycosyltransferase involved in cell wall biosynthesis
MRVLLVIYGSLDQQSGGYLYDRQVVGYLRGRRVEVEILSLPRCTYLFCPLTSLRRTGLQGRLRRLLQGRDDGRRFDAVIVDELVHPSAFRAVARRGTAGPPLLTLVHHLRSQEPGGALLRWIALGMERVLLRHSNAVVVNSRVTAQTVRKLVEQEIPLYLCPPGNDLLPGLDRRLDRLRPAGAPAREVRLLVTGNLIHRKGHDLLLRMLAGLRQKPWRLRIVGPVVDHRYRRRLGRLERRLGLSGRVEYTGELSGSELAREYRTADVFVFPSRYEGYGISLAEALRAGLPFVAFAAGATAEVTGGRGLLFPPGDLEGFASALERLVTDPEARSQAAILSRELSAGLPGWSDTGRRFHEALTEVVGHA